MSFWSIRVSRIINLQQKNKKKKNEPSHLLIVLKDLRARQNYAAAKFSGRLFQILLALIIALKTWRKSRPRNRNFPYSTLFDNDRKRFRLPIKVFSLISKFYLKALIECSVVPFWQKFLPTVKPFCQAVNLFLHRVIFPFFFYLFTEYFSVNLVRKSVNKLIIYFLHAYLIYWRKASSVQELKSQERETLTEWIEFFSFRSLRPSTQTNKTVNANVQFCSNKYLSRSQNSPFKIIRILRKIVLNIT